MDCCHWEKWRRLRWSAGCVYGYQFWRFEKTNKYCELSFTFKHVSICWNLQNGEAYSKRSGKAFCWGHPHLEHVRDAGAPPQRTPPRDTVGKLGEPGEAQHHSERLSHSEAGCLWGGTSTCGGWTRTKQLQISLTWVDIKINIHKHSWPSRLTQSVTETPSPSNRKRICGHMTPTTSYIPKIIRKLSET